MGLFYAGLGESRHGFHMASPSLTRTTKLNTFVPLIMGILPAKTEVSERWAFPGTIDYHSAHGEHMVTIPP